MALQGSRINPGRWDSELNPLPCDRYNNAELTIAMRVFLEQANPAGGADKGTAKEWGTDASGTGSGHGTARKIVKWTPETWNRFRRRYKSEVQSYWDGKFWLVNTANFAEMDFEDRKVTYRPNLWCRFTLEVADSAAKAHTTISVVRLGPDERVFRSDSGHYDDHDLNVKSSAHSGKTYSQRAHLHEVGHLLGLGHAAETSSACVSGGNVGAEACYCSTPDDCANVMGAGEKIRESNASPWQKAIDEHGGGSAANWTVYLKQHYPRTLEDVRLGREITACPSRG
jgi:hypothetical protein